MKKSLIALAIAGTFAAPAFAATGNIDISGKIAADVASVSGLTKVAGATGNGMHVNNNNSVITVAGKEDLGGGMNAFFSVTYGLPLTSGGALSGQNQIAGIEGGFGKVFLGAFDNPVKVIGRGVDLFADQSTGDARNITSINVADARANDVIAYLTPNMSGFQAALVHANMNAGAASNSGKINVIKVAYANGPLSVALAYDTRDQTVDSKDLRLTGSYTIGDARIVALYQKNDNVGGAVSTDDRTVWGLGGAYAMGPITLKTQYYTVDQKNSANDANMWALGADYSLSKRTTMQLAYSKITNKGAAVYGCGSVACTGAAAAANVVANADALDFAGGKDPSSISVGLKHTF